MHFDDTASSALSSDILHEKKLFYKRQTKGKKSDVTRKYGISPLTLSSSVK